MTLSQIAVACLWLFCACQPGIQYYSICNSPSAIFTICLVESHASRNGRSRGLPRPISNSRPAHRCNPALWGSTDCQRWQCHCFSGRRTFNIHPNISKPLFKFICGRWKQNELDGKNKKENGATSRIKVFFFQMYVFVNRLRIVLSTKPC